MDRHCLNHAVYRNWCEFCVRGRGKEAPHKSKGTQEMQIPVICMDFGFLREEPKVAGEESRPILVTKCRKTGHLSADMLVSKDHSYGVRRLIQYVEKVLGYKRMIMRGDQEPGLVSLKNKVRVLGQFEVIEEAAPTGDSQSQGDAENAVELVQAMARSLKLALEARIGAEIPEEHPIIPWVIRHAAQVINRHRIGEDGLTRHRRLKGKNFDKEVAEIGESVWFLYLKSKGRNKMRSRWSSGLWLGIRDESGEAIIGTDEGVMKCRTIKRKGTREERWDLGQVEKMKGVPWEPEPGREEVEIEFRL